MASGGHSSMMSSSKQSSSTDQTATTNISRVAIDQSGCIGSLYDGCRDCILGKLGINFKTKLDSLSNSSTCCLKQGRTALSQNLLEMIGIERELRLSIALKMLPATGIASLISYSRPIDKHTRFLHFCQESRRESCHDGLDKVKKSLKSHNSQTLATHIITAISWGIHVIVVIQLPSDQEVEIDRLLDRTCGYLSSNTNTVEITPEEKCLFDRILITTVFSNIPDLAKMTNIVDVYQRICRIKTNPTEHRRLKYFLSSIECFYPKYAGGGVTWIPLESAEPLEYYLLQRSSELKVLKFRLDYELPELLQGTLEEQLNDAQQELSNILDLDVKDTQRIYRLVRDIRKGKPVPSSFDEDVSLNAQTKIRTRIDNFISNLDELTSKGDFIKKLQNEGVEYCNVARHGIQRHYNQEMVERILLMNDSQKYILCSNDYFKKHQQWKELYSQFTQRRQANGDRCLVYADFTYCAYELQNMTIIPSSMERIRDVCVSDSEASARKPEKRQAPLLPSSTSDEIINILLLGESGVGKSTFINAFANCLQFETLEKAQAGKPVVLIPLSFVWTINDEFDECIIKYGDTDDNEDHSNSGQSVTQQCKSYQFKISEKKKLRIIDTPGFGDTRGLDQDDFNMEHIFSFINNLTHLNAVCILLKPNVTQLNPSFRSCCIQLFHFCGQSIANNFVFCFTNARSTFFTPGNTRPLLRTFFDSFPVENILLEKKNTFCFDNESFRYLIAVQNAIEFDEDQKREYEQSWSRSVIEAKRFQDFLCAQSIPYRKHYEWQSIKQAQLEIDHVIRPMLEAMRNVLRNLLLYDNGSSIALRPKHVSPFTTICYACDRVPKKFGNFWILPDQLHKSGLRVSTNSMFKTATRKYFDEKTMRNTVHSSMYRR